MLKSYVMSIKISLLKNAKILISDWLKENYKGDFNVFYSIGTQENNYKDQFLKVKLDCDIKKFPLFASKIRHELLLKDSIYSDLKFKITNF